MTEDELDELQARAFAQYECLGLVPLLEQMRQEGRYEGCDGLNILTNAELTNAYSRSRAIAELRSAAAFDTEPYEPGLLQGRQGLAFGLNPYTDWALSQLDAPPERWFLIMGLDWYSVSKLLPETWPAERWYDYIADPFTHQDPYWYNLWAWILGKYHRDAPEPGVKDAWLSQTTGAEAADFIRSNRIAFIFHNWIPYLRPADVSSTAKNWPHTQWAEEKVNGDIVADLSTLRETVGGEIQAFCSNADICGALKEAGFSKSQVRSLRAHPSYHKYFTPGRLRKNNISFPVAPGGPTCY